MDLFAIFKRKKKGKHLPIARALEDKRADLAVSDWLQAAFNHTPDDALPKEVLHAYRSDKFLCEVNSGGFDGFFNWEFENIESTLAALKELKLDSISKLSLQAIELISGKQAFDSREQYDEQLEQVMDDDKRSAKLEKLGQKAMDASGKIEQATHEYVRRHLAAFQKLDGVVEKSP